MNPGGQTLVRRKTWFFPLSSRPLCFSLFIECLHVFTCMCRCLCVVVHVEAHSCCQEPSLISLPSYLMSQSLPIKFRAAMPSPAQMMYVGIQTPMLMLGGRHALATELLPSLPQGILVLFHHYFLLPPGERSQAPLPSTCYPFLNPTVLLQ